MQRSILILATLLVAVTFGPSAAADAALGGHCPVAYVEMNKAVKGDPEVSMEFAGRHYVFVNAEAKKMFEVDPVKYRVAYDGYCATAVSMGKLLDSDPTLFSLVDGTTYLFSSAEAKRMFDEKQAEVIAAADEKWPVVHPAFGGHCPVAYAVMNKAVKGQPDISLVHDETLYVFANADAKKMFEADPAKYTVAYDGHCATAMAMGKLYPSDPEVFTVKDGVTFLFSSAKAKEMFDAKSAELVSKANEHWASMK